MQCDRRNILAAECSANITLLSVDGLPEKYNRLRIVLRRFDLVVGAGVGVGVGGVLIFWNSSLIRLCSQLILTSLCLQKKKGGCFSGFRCFTRQGG